MKQNPSRSLIFACAALVLGSWAMPVAAQRPQRRARIDPSLRMLMRQHDRRPPARPGARPARPAGELDALPLSGRHFALDDRGPGGQTRVGVFIRLRDRGRALAELRAAGAEIGTVAGGIATARVPLDALERLGSSHEIERIEAARLLRVRNDSGVVDVRADGVRRRVDAAWLGSAGQGVIIGVYDTGLDYRHEDFRDAAGRTRVLGLWDQTAQAAAAPPGYGYGAYCPPETLQDGSCEQIDSNGHGTHVAGTAAGDGSAGSTPFRYAGVAPTADLLIVKGGNGTFETDRIVDGVAWIFERAGQLGRPAVVNLSLGSIAGPHDGSALFEQMLDALSGPGRIITVAAGNDGSNGNNVPAQPVLPLHVSGTPLPGSPAEFTFEVPAYTARSGECNDFVLLELWYEDGDRFDFTVVRPDGSTVSAAHQESVFQDHSAGSVWILADTLAYDEIPNGDHPVLLLVTDCPSGPVGSGQIGPPAAGTWTVRVTAQAPGTGQPFHGWITNTQFGTSALPAVGRNGFDNRYIIGSPGSAREVVTVAGYVTRTCLTDTGATFCSAIPEANGDIASFSSPGPTRDGRAKPDIAAPARLVISALSRNAVPDSRLLLPDGVHWALQGTSMATPHVTGAIALLLQADPTLTPADVKRILGSTARQDSFTTRTYAGGAGTPADWWGAGKLDVTAALGSITDTTGIALVHVLPAVDSLVHNVSAELAALATTRFGNAVPATIQWRSTDPSIATVDDQGRVRAVAPGTVHIVASTATAADSARIVVLPPSTLIVTAEPVRTTKPASSRAGSRVPLLRLRIGVDGHEEVDLTGLAFDVAGTDPGARFLLFRDADGGGTIDAGDTVLAELPVELRAGTSVRATVPIEGLRVGPQVGTTLLAAVQMSGAAPNLAGFEVAAVATGTRSVGVLSGVADRVTHSGGTTAASVPATVLGAGELFAMSENPVRSGRVVFNFAEVPTVAGVYTLSGRRVVDLLPRLDGAGRVEWDLSNDAGSPVAPGVYLVVFDVRGQLFRHKLMVLRPAGAG